MSDPRSITIPPGLGEDDLLAWVEGAPLPRDTAGAVARALDADPALARVLDAMKRDRAALRAIPDEAAPDGLAAGARAMLEPALERRMLLGLESDAPGSGTPVSIVQPSRRSLLGPIFLDRTGRRFAAAAALLLLAGGTTWLVTGMLSRGAIPPRPLRVADAGEPDPPPAHAEAAKTHEPVTLASAAPADPAADEPVFGPPEPPVVIAQVPPAPAPMSAARAAELARERRLVIRVAARTLDETAARIESLASRARPESAWRISAATPAPVVAALTPRADPPPRPAPDPHELAAARSAPDFVGPMPAPRGTLAAAPQRRVYSVDARLDESALAALLATLADNGQSAEFVEAAEPLPLQPPALTAPALLWWTQPPACWVPWGGVPIVVEQR